MGGPNSGRRPTPTALKILTGNPGRRPLNDNEPQPRRVAPPMPEWFDAKAKAIWDDTCSELAQMGTLASSDQAVIAAFCQSYRNWVEYQQAAIITPVQENIFVTGSGEEVRTIKASPFVKMAKDEKASMRAFAMLLGLDPSSRSRLKATPVAGGEGAERLLDKIG